MHRAPGRGGLEGSAEPQTCSPTPNATAHFMGAPLPQERQPHAAPEPPKQVGEHPLGWMEQALPLHPEDSAEGLQQAASPARGLAHGHSSFCPAQQFFRGCTAASHLVGRRRSTTRARATRSSLGITIAPAPKIWRGDSFLQTSSPLAEGGTDARAWGRTADGPVVGGGWLRPRHISCARRTGQKYQGYFGSPQTEAAFGL